MALTCLRIDRTEFLLGRTSDDLDDDVLDIRSTLVWHWLQYWALSYNSINSKESHH